MGRLERCNERGRTQTKEAIVLWETQIFHTGGSHQAPLFAELTCKVKMWNVKELLPLESWNPKRGLSFFNSLAVSRVALGWCNLQLITSWTNISSVLWLAQAKSIFRDHSSCSGDISSSWDVTTHQIQCLLKLEKGQEIFRAVLESVASYN